MMNTSRIKILVCYHKPATLVENEIFVPIHAGRAQRGFSKDGIIADANRQWLLDHMIGDDTGENISEKTLTYSELTALYWAWKNYDALGNPDYIGLMHYRRFLLLTSDPSSDSRLSDRQIHIDIPRLTEDSQDRYLNTRDIIRNIAHHDIYLYKKYTHANRSEREITYRKWKREVDISLEYLRKEFPNIYPYAHAYFSRDWGARCNLMVMKRELFFEYCSFIFEFIKGIEGTINQHLPYYCAKDRVFGRIAEYMLGIWALYKQESTGCSVCGLPILYVKNTTPRIELKPAFTERNVPIVCACDNNYALPCAVMIKSIMEQASPEFNYDLIILDNGLSENNISKLKSSTTSPRPNFSLRFYKMHPHMHGKRFVKRGHRSVTAYCKLFVPEILKNYDKALYMDADTLVMHDVASLYATELHDQWIGACLDYSLMQQLRNKYNCTMPLSLSYINLNDVLYQYVNTGVLLLNLAELRKNGINSKWESTALSHDYENMEQDVLNQHILGHVHFLDSAWNVPHNMKGMSSLPREHFAKLTSVDRPAPKIIHYTTSDKPWENPAADMAHHWWSYARQTPFYEEIVYKYLQATATKQAKKLIATHEEKVGICVPADIVRDIALRWRLCLLYQWYLLRAYTTFGKLKRHYQHKKGEVKQRMLRVQNYLGSL